MDSINGKPNIRTAKVPIVITPSGVSARRRSVGRQRNAKSNTFANQSLDQGWDALINAHNTSANKQSESRGESFMLRREALMSQGGRRSAGEKRSGSRTLGQSCRCRRRYSQVPEYATTAVILWPDEDDDEVLCGNVGARRLSSVAAPNRAGYGR